jgi:hypothetical protein
MLFAGRKDITGMRWLTKTGVGVEKLSSRKSAEIRTRQDALQTTFSARLDIFYPPNFP